MIISIIMITIVIIIIIIIIIIVINHIRSVISVEMPVFDVPYMHTVYSRPA